MTTDTAPLTLEALIEKIEAADYRWAVGSDEAAIYAARTGTSDGR